MYFAAAGIQRANFTGANLTRVNFGASYLEGVILLSANMNGVKSGGITGAPVQMPPGWRFMNGYLLGPQVDLSGANLASFDLTGMNLSGATLNNALLTSANLTRADLSQVDIRKAGITGTVLLRANLTNADFGGGYGKPAVYTNTAFLNTTCPDGARLTSPRTCWDTLVFVSEVQR
ncbi:MAG: pentapeptide repeat-containing protein [Anaerolineae bacterium]|nr:pentapeptide repeat-containing protein [Anaerolineae bacterium]